MAVPLRVVVVGVDDHLAVQGLDRDAADHPQWHGHHGQVGGVAARARGPNSATNAASDCGPLDLLITTS